MRFLEVGAARVPGATAPEIGCGLTPDHHEAMDRGDRGEHEHDPEHRHKDVEREPDAEQHETLGAFHEATTRREPERLRSGPLVGDQHRQRDDGQHEHRQVPAFVREVPRDTEEDRGIGDAVAHGVEERTAWAGATTLARHRAVEDVGQAGEDEPDHAEHEMAVRDEERSADGEGEPDDREAVGGDADSVQAATDGFEPSLDIGAPASVEHVRGASEGLFRIEGTTGHPANPACVDSRQRANGGSELAAKTYPTEKIRNVALVGHGGAGKTSVAEALLFVSGTTTRLGRVEDGSTVTDFDPEEARRQISVSLAPAPFEFEGYKINVIDTPGYADFVSDVAAALRAADLAVFVVSAVEGVEVQTEMVWRMASELGLPRAVFVNKLDRERASFSRTLDELKSKFGAGIAPLDLPIGEETAFRGVVDLLNDEAIVYEDGKGTSGPVPDEMEAEEHAVHDALVEGIVVADDSLMERYLSDEKIDTAELAAALAQGVKSGEVFPVLCGSATKLIGIDRLAHFLAEEGPAPDVGDGQPVAFVFKTIVDPYVGRVNLFKVLQGTVKTDATLVNGRSMSEERLHQLTVMRGKDQDPVPEVPAGDIAAVAKLSNTTTGDVLGARGAAVDVEPFDPPQPVLAVAIHAKSKGDEDKLANALHRLLDEDPALRLERNAETHQTLLWGMGETHLGIALERLHRKLGVEVETEDVKVAYRETIAGNAEAEGKYKKQTGGHGQFGVAFVRVEPLPPGSGFEFVDQIVGGAIPRQFIPAVEKGVAETMEHGGVFGFPVVDVKVTCFDGKYHSVDSSEMSFKMAGSIGFKDAMAKASPTLLEPISELTVIAPEANQGDIMGDLNSKRGRIQSSGAIGNGEVEIVAFVPTSEVLRYVIDLRSMTGGRGRFSLQHSHYDPVPSHLVDKVRANAEPAKV